MLQLINISVHINNQHILRTINTQAQPGDIILVVGRNGSGKSTLLATIAGRLKPTSGSIIINNHDITNWNERQRTKKISTLFQNPAMNTAGTLTVAQNFALAQLKNKTATFHNALTRISSGTTHSQLLASNSIMHKRMSELSGGQQQLIAFTMATCIPPSILLLDEPTAALDHQATQQLLSQIKQQTITQKIITIIVTHELEYIEQLGNKVWILNNGVLRAVDTKKESISIQKIKEMIHE